MNRDDFVGWHKSRHSDQENGGCVGMGYAPRLRGIEDTTLGANSPIAVLGETAVQNFLTAVKDGRLA
jgi:hypothetical protein